MAQRRRTKPSPFPETRWSLVGRASAEDEATRQAALEELLTAYTPGLRSFLVNSRRITADRADDLLHDFIADKILSRKLVQRADQGRGRFRNLVLKALSNHVSSQLRKDASRATTTSLEALDVDVLATRDVDRFHREWVHQVIQDALVLMQRDCEQRERHDLWRIFQMRVVGPMLDAEAPTTYEDAVACLGIGSPRQAMNLLVTAKRCFLRQLRAAVGRYVGHEESRIDEEIEDLRGLLGHSISHAGDRP